MARDEQSNIKDVGGFVGGYLSGGTRKNANVMYRTVATLDIDYGTANVWDDLTMASICYMKANLMSFENAIEDFPWASSCFKPKDKLRNLVRAGALIAAEIDKFLEESEAKNE